MIKLFFCLIFLVISDAVQGSHHYTYSKSANGWLKLHAVPAEWKDAYTNCNAEGAVLASPLNADIMDNLRVQMLLNKVDRPVFLGVNAMLSNGYFVSIEGVPLDDMPVIWGSYGDGTKTESCLTFTSEGKVYASSCSVYLPYFCYKKKVNEVMNEEPSIIEYKLNATTGSCYKKHMERKTWSKANKVCLAEAGHLVVLNNLEEVEIILDLISDQITPYNPNPHNPIIHVGLLFWNNDFSWVTVTGEKIDDVYNEWGRNQNLKMQDTRACLLADSNLGTCYYSREFSFVCEKNPNTVQFERVADDYTVN